jgi:hypothetical protein
MIAIGADVHGFSKLEMCASSAPSASRANLSSRAGSVESAIWERNWAAVATAAGLLPITGA